MLRAAILTSSFLLVMNCVNQAGKGDMQ
jgi:hypothetical protein